MRKEIHCPICGKGILFAEIKTVPEGITEHKCKWCKSIVEYDHKTMDFACRKFGKNVELKTSLKVTDD